MFTTDEVGFEKATENVEIEEIKAKLCKDLFESITRECDPKSMDSKEDVFNFIYKQGKYRNNFVGGMNDERRTKHEKIFHLLFPHLTQQVHFGSGKGGLDKYGFKKITVDFLCEKTSIAIEIDGPNHKEKLQSLKDNIKELFLKNEHGIDTVRFTNEEVEGLLKDRLEKVVFSNSIERSAEILGRSGFLDE